MNEADKEDFDAFMAAANFYREVRAARIGREWSVTLGLWAVLTASAISFPATIFAHCKGLIWVLSFIVVGFHIAWLVHHFSLHEKEAARMYYYRDRAEALAVPKESPNQPPSLPDRGLLRDLFVPAAQLIVTAVLALVAALAIIGRTP